MPSKASSGDLTEILGAMAGAHPQVVGTAVCRSTPNDVYLHITGAPPDAEATTEAGPE
jgi:hypothetical protein